MTPVAASHTLPHSSTIPQISKLGILTLYGYGIRVTMQAGHLQLEDGIGPDRRKLRLPRVAHGLKRLVCIGEDGFVTLSALRWLSDVGASFVMLDRLGKVRVVTGPTSASEARLRRAQALAVGNGTAILIAREIIAAKLRGQETLVREKLVNAETANVIAAFRDCLSQAHNIDAIRVIESRAAAAYWSAWHELPILFARKDAKRVPSHWLRFGTRRSPLTGGPRLSVNPANTLINYTNAVAESECRLGASACGLDPGIGFIHTDTANRDSLALDLIEPIRPAVEAWLLDWLMREPLRRSDFFETANGNCRISSDLCSKLSGTAPTWGKLVAPWAEYVAHSLLSGTTQVRAVPGLKTPLTQSHRREAKCASAPRVKLPKTEHHCRGCGKPIGIESDHCAKCAAPLTRRTFDAGRKMAHDPESRARRSITNKAQAERIKNWRPTELPTWLTRQCYLSRIVPALATVTKAQIRSALDISEPHASYIQNGKRIPHARHWQTLAELAQVSSVEVPNTIHEVST
jgi:CRISPR-associated endonuclease Cas1